MPSGSLDGAFVEGNGYRGRWFGKLNGMRDVGVLPICHTATVRVVNHNRVLPWREVGECGCLFECACIGSGWAAQGAKFGDETTGSAVGRDGDGAILQSVAVDGGYGHRVPERGAGGMVMSKLYPSPSE